MFQLQSYAVLNVERFLTLPIGVLAKDFGSRCKVSNWKHLKLFISDTLQIEKNN